MALLKQELDDILKQADMLKKFVGELVVEVKRETESIENYIAEDAVARRRQSEFSNLLNQGGTSSVTLGAENRNGCVDTIQKVPELSNSEEDWLKSEMSRRIGTHIWLIRLLGDLISIIG